MRSRIKYSFTYMMYFFEGTGIGQEFFSSRPQYGVPEPRTSRSNRFVRALFSMGGSNAPRPALSVPYVAGNAHGDSGWHSSNDLNFAFSGGTLECYFGPWRSMESLKKWNMWILFHKCWHHFQICIWAAPLPSQCFLMYAHFSWSAWSRSGSLTYCVALLFSL